jgi:hypothetical protein
MRKTLIIIALGISSVGSISAVMSDSDRRGWDKEDRNQKEHESEEHEYDYPRGGWLESREDVAPVRNETYQTECGDCHFAFQPGLLSASAWQQIMDSLGEHYGDDASLDEAQAAEIRSYLSANAAERSALSRSRAFAATRNADDSLPRITNTDYFKREHYEIPARFVRGNEEVRSFSNCKACHRNADAGVYNEHQVVIPGVGRWDD